jgi:hypothetical protein
MNNVIKLHDSPRPTAPPVGHLLRAIRDSYSDTQRRPLQQRAYEHFAKLNGWQVGGKKKWCPFDLKVLQDRIFDHYRCFDKALIAEPYSHVDWYDIGMTLAARHYGHHGLACHMPPHRTASIYSPGRCAFLVFTRPGHVVKWLPEMVGGIVDGGST